MSQHLLSQCLTWLCHKLLLRNRVSSASYVLEQPMDEEAEKVEHTAIAIPACQIN